MFHTFLHPRFSKKTKIILLKSGWYPGRQLSIQALSQPAKTIALPAKEIYVEFGSLTISFTRLHTNWPVIINIDWNMDDDDILSLNNLDETNITSPVNSASNLSYLEFTRLAEDQQAKVIKQYISEHNLTETSLYETRLGADCTVLGYMNDFKYDGENEYIVSDTKGHIYLVNDGSLLKVAESFDGFLRNVTTEKW